MATINGTSGNDTLLGSSSDDIINGFAGADIITGGLGADTLTGGTGPDIFRDTAAGLNGDTITDFLPGDRIQLTDLDLSTTTFGISGSLFTYTSGSVSGSITIDGIGPGRFVARAITGGGVEVRLQQDAHNDFNGDGHSDILWRSDDGRMTSWLGQPDGSLSYTAASDTTSVPTSVHIVGTGDFNGDGRVDILWRAEDGTLTDWLGHADGSFSYNPASYTWVPTDWHIAGTGDFNGDGRTDILWRADSGRMTSWLGQADGSLSYNAASDTTSVPTSVQIAGTGDFNGDGIDDILWRAADGTVTNWLGQPDGSFAYNPSSYTWVPTDWHIAATGDFNGDGRSDILWRADDGRMTDWLGQPDGSLSYNPASYTTTVPTSVHIADTGDFNADGIDDILWRAADGTVTSWLGQPDGSFAYNPASYTWVPTDWHIQSPFTHDVLV